MPMTDPSDQVRVLLQRLEAVQDAERRELARELHDDFGQSLAILQNDLSRLRSMIGHLNPSANRLAEDMSTLLEVMLQRVRSLTLALHPSALEDLGLDSAVQTYVQHFARRTGLKALVDVRHAKGSLDRPRALAAFRVLRESLTNVVRHAHASKVIVTLSVTPIEMTLEVADDGRGIERDRIHARESLGLLTMRERAAEFGGTLRVGRRESPAPGTLVVLKLPMGLTR